MEQTECVVIGAGPHGLSAVAHLRRAGVEPRVFGRPMSFWRTMPRGMLLRSNRTATSIAEYDGPLSLEEYCRGTGTPLVLPLPLDEFCAYGEWVHAQVAPDADPRLVTNVRRGRSGLQVTLEDGEEVLARNVVVAAGIADFVHRPDLAADLPPELCSHTSAHRDLSRFRDASLLVVGGGQSALESAALAREAGARDVTVVARTPKINWLHGGRYHRLLGRYAKLVYAPTDVGPMGLSRLVAEPGLFRKFPQTLADPMAARSIRPAGAAWLRPRLVDVPVLTGRRVVVASPRGDGVEVQLDNGERRRVDHLMMGTGYRVDLARYPFLDPDLQVATIGSGGYPLLDSTMQSSVPGLFFVGATAARAIGPTMRFVSGSWYAGRAVARAVAPPRAGAKASRPGPVPSAA
ncbi:MAG: FAD-dependent oxidoreductase [Nocardioidaceae bacterium]